MNQQPTPDGIPPEIKAIVDRAAGKTHSASGPVMRCLAEVLAAHRQLLLGDAGPRETLREQLAARDAALAACTAQLVHDQAALARVRRLADQWQAAMRPGERHPAAAAIRAALDPPDHDGGPAKEATR